MTDEKFAVYRWIDEGNPNCQDVEENSQADRDVSSLNFNSGGVANRIYEILAEYQATGDWRHKELAAELLRWAQIFNAEFALAVSEIALCVDSLSSDRFGHFRSGHNGFGLKGEIALNERYLQIREPWQILGTLLHELIHAWQYEHGEPGVPPYHNKQFRNKAREYGLVISEYGVTEYEMESRFKELLKKHGIRMPDQPRVAPRLPGKSKLKKWSCLCPINIRVAVADFEARCMKCGHLFVRA
jgi:hypothetical protein